MVTVETLALLGWRYALPRLSSGSTSNSTTRSTDGVRHACDMFMAYIGVLRVPYRHNEQFAVDILRGLDKYLDDLISPKVWIKLDDLVKAKSRGEKFGEQQLLNPLRKTLFERMSINIKSPGIVGDIEAQVPSFKLDSPSLLHSPAPRSNHPRSPSTPTGPRYTLPPRPISPHTSNSDHSDGGVGPKRSRQRSKRGSEGGPMDQSRRGQEGPRFRIDPGQRWFER
jgi:hypothetical protein